MIRRKKSQMTRRTIRRRVKAAPKAKVMRSRTTTKTKAKRSRPLASKAASKGGVRPTIRLQTAEGWKRARRRTLRQLKAG